MPQMCLFRFLASSRNRRRSKPPHKAAKQHFFHFIASLFSDGQKNNYIQHRFFANNNIFSTYRHCYYTILFFESQWCFRELVFSIFYTNRRLDAVYFTLTKKAPSLKAQRERLRLVCAFWVSACYGTLHNSDNDLCGTEIRCASRLWHIGTLDVPSIKQIQISIKCFAGKGTALEYNVLSNDSSVNIEVV